MFRKKIVCILATLTCVFCFVGFVGCSQTSDIMALTKGNTQENVYVTSLNSLMQGFYGSLDGFSDDVKNKDIDAINKKIKSCQDVIDSINKLDVPDSCKEAQEKYIAGLTSLKQCLEEYVQVFNDKNQGKIDDKVLQERVANIQKTYNQALESLKVADKLISNVAS